jgi:general secretion pathway protein K
MRDEKGIVLVLTLMILALITAMVVEFSYGVYTTTSALTNWKELQRLSFVSKSGVSLAVKTIQEWQGKDELYKYLDVKIPFENMMEGFNGSLVISAEDENGKFNLNSLRLPASQKVFKNLLRKLGLDESIADRVAYWINKNSVPGLINSQEVTKNSSMDSVDELLLIRGIDAKTYEALLPYVTVYSYPGVGSSPNVMGEDTRVNMNTASIPVIMSLDERITLGQAKEVVNQRKLQPFEGSGDLQRAGFDQGLITAITANILVGKQYPPAIFRITSVAEENGIKRVIESVVAVYGNSQSIFYWREM